MKTQNVNNKVEQKTGDFINSNISHLNTQETYTNYNDSDFQNNKYVKYKKKREFINNKDRWIIYTSLVILYVIIIMILCKLFPREANHENMGFDYIGAIVGVLSLLVSFLAVLLGYNIFSLDNRIDKSVNKKIRDEMQNSISDTKAQLYYSASLINKESNQIGLELHNLFLSINECLNNDITTNDEYNIIQYRIYEIIEIFKKQERDFDINFAEPQLSNYIEISKKMIGEKSNEILQYLLSKKNQIKSDKS